MASHIKCQLASTPFFKKKCRERSRTTPRLPQGTPQNHQGRSIWYYIVLNWHILYYPVIYYTVLYYTIVCYTMLYYGVLCCDTIVEIASQPLPLHSAVPQCWDPFREGGFGIPSHYMILYYTQLLYIYIYMYKRILYNILCFPILYFLMQWWRCIPIPSTIFCCKTMYYRV